MWRVKATAYLSVCLTGLLLSGFFLVEAQAQGGVTVFEGARLIVGDGSVPIENAVFIVNGNRFTEVGRAGQVQVPAGAHKVEMRYAQPAKMLWVSFATLAVGIGLCLFLGFESRKRQP